MSPDPSLCPGQGRGLRAALSNPGDTRRASDGEASLITVFLFPPASRVVFDFRKPTAKRPTTGSTTACSCSTAMVRAGSPRGRPRRLRGCRAQQRPASPGSPPLPALAAGTRAAPAGPSPRASPGSLPPAGPAPLLTPVPYFRDQDGAGFLRPTHRLHDQAGGCCGAAAEQGGWQPSGRPREAKPAPAAGPLCPAGQGRSRRLPLRPPTGLRGSEGVPVGPCLRLGCGRKIQATLQPSQSGLRMVLSLN